MCFSATGSIGVGSVLAGIGVVSLARSGAPSHRLLAAIPLLFAAQQIAEGGVWLTLHDPDHALLLRICTAAFLAVALMVWPVWMPLALVLAETNPRRRRLLLALTAVGCAVAAFACGKLVQQLPVAVVKQHSLSYSYRGIGSARVIAIYLPGYVLPAVVPFFVSTMTHARLMGVVLIASLIATFIIEREALTSVWCFFAAILSGLIALSTAVVPRLDRAHAA